MFLSKLKFSSFFFSVLIFSFAHISLGQTSAGESKVAKKKQQKKIIRSFSLWEMGVGYVQWNEPIQISQGTLEGQGLATFAGPLVSIERNQFYRKWQWGLSIFSGLGRAASGNFSNNLTFPDGINRAWWMMGSQLYIGSRINNLTSLDLGIVTRYRSVDWEPANQTLSVESKNPSPIYPQISFRIRVLRTATLIQSYSPIGWRGNSQWTWTAQYVF